MASGPHGSNLAGVNAETMPELYSKMNGAFRKMIGPLPKEKAKGPAIITKACPDIRNPMVSGIARLAAQAEGRDNAQNNNHEDIGVIDRNNEDKDKDGPTSVPTSLRAAGPARA